MNYEVEFIQMCLKQPDLINQTIVRPSFFKDSQLAKIFESLEKHAKFNPVEFINDGLEIGYVTDLYVNAMDYSEPLQIFKSYELKVINAHKTRLLKKANRDLETQKISYEEWKEQVDRIDDIRQIEKTSHFTLNEIENALFKEKKYLMFRHYLKLSNILKLNNDDLVTVAGESGFGKSTLMMCLFSDLLKDDNVKCQYYNLEINNDQVIQKLTAINSQLTMSDVTRKELDDVDKENQRQYAIELIANKDYYIYNDSINWEKLKVSIITNLSKDKQNVVFIDHLGLIGLKDKSYNKSEYDRITFIMKELRKLCKSYNVLIIVASQLDRTSVKTQTITMNSLKSSGEIENSSTHVVLLYQNKQLEQEDINIKNVVVNIAKNRNYYIAKLNMQMLNAFQRFIEVN